MSKKFTKELVDDLADKLLIGLSSEENEMVLSEFDEIDANIDLINELIELGLNTNYSGKAKVAKAEVKIKFPAFMGVSFAHTSCFQ